MKYKAGDMVFSINGAAWYYVLNRHKSIHMGVKGDSYLMRRLAPPMETMLTAFSSKSFDNGANYLLIGNMPAYNWEGFMAGKDEALLDATDLALKAAGHSLRVGKNVPAHLPLPVPSAPSPVFPTPNRVLHPPKGKKVKSSKAQSSWTKLIQGTFIVPKAEPQVRKKVAGEDSDCHCGSYAVGITSKGKGHSSWCPMAKE